MCIIRASAHDCMSFGLILSSILFYVCCCFGVICFTFHVILIIVRSVLCHLGEQTLYMKRKRRKELCFPISEIQYSVAIDEVSLAADTISQLLTTSMFGPNTLPYISIYI